MDEDNNSLGEVEETKNTSPTETINMMIEDVDGEDIEKWATSLSPWQVSHKK